MASRFKLTLVVVLGLVSAANQSFAAATKLPAGYDELYDEQGELRPQYNVLRDEIENESVTDRRRFMRESKESLKGDNAVDQLPRILTLEEYKVVKAGVRQRAIALRMFLRDHYSGKKSYVSQKVIPKAVIDRIFARSMESVYEGLVKPEMISFFYGPDVIRGVDGKFYVIEDNPGFIGGLGDLKINYDLMLKRYPQLKDTIKPVDPMEFYGNLVEHFNARAAEYGGKAVAIFPGKYSDHENLRLRAIFRSLGLEVLSAYSGPSLRFDKDGVFTQARPGARRERVGYVAFYDEHDSIDAQAPSQMTRWHLSAARGYLRSAGGDAETKERLRRILYNVDSTGIDPAALATEMEKIYTFAPRKSFANGITQAILDGKVGSSNSPGSMAVGDKEFYVYVPDLIRFYLNEEPILNNLPTWTFAKGKTGAVDQDLLDCVMDDPTNYVIKPVDGRCGKGVQVGAKIPRAEFRKSRSSIAASPGGYIVQQMMPLSTFRDNIVDMRPITFVDTKRVFVAVPWGRGTPQEGNGKVNVSGGGIETTTLVAGVCERALLKKASGD